MTTSAPTPTRFFRGRNRNLQWLRALSALLVLAFHAGYYLGEATGYREILNVLTAEFGLLAVSIFFAISGALMADLVKTMPLTDFLIHRMVRIYPLVTILAIFLPFLLGTGRISIDMRALSLVPIGDNGSYRLAVEWTLVFELFLYMVVFLVALIGFARRIELFAAGWLAVVVSALLIFPDTTQSTLTPTIAQIPFMAANAAFAGGMLIPWLANRGVFQPALAVVAFALTSISVSVEIPAGRVLTSFAAVVFVGLAVVWEDRAMRDNWATRLATNLGDWSYALYLCHVPVLLAVFSNVSAPPLVLWGLGIAAAVALCVPLGKFDNWLYRILKRRFDRSAKTTRLRWVVGYCIFYAAFAIVFLFKD